MGFISNAGNRVKWVLRTLIRGLRQAGCTGSHPCALEGPAVFAVTERYPTRILLYAAAFQGGWKVEFMKSLRDVLEAVRNRRPKAVFYDHENGAFKWSPYCSALAAEGIPFILLAHKNCDETFLTLLANGGYQAWGNPLSSEDIVKAVDLAQETAAICPLPVG